VYYFFVRMPEDVGKQGEEDINKIDQASQRWDKKW
jgi:hypothetical protein